MHEHPALALREKKDASILVAMDLVKRGEADAVVTAGHTGAGMAAAVLRLGPRARASTGRRSPSRWWASSRPFVLLDIGANPDSTPENLAQYARMGAIFSERVLGVDRPRVALLSIGEEKGKGDARIQRATELLDATDLNFIGNVEGKDLTDADGRRRRLRRRARQRRDQVLRGPVGLHLRPAARPSSGAGSGAASPTCCCGPGIARIRKIFDYEVVGGSPLLGVRGAVIITHGRARRRMIEHAVRVGATTARERVAGADRRGARRRRAPTAEAADDDDPAGHRAVATEAGS